MLHLPECHKVHCCLSQVSVKTLCFCLSSIWTYWRYNVSGVRWDRKHVSGCMCTFTCDFTRNSSHYVYRLYLYLLSSFCLCGTTSLLFFQASFLFFMTGCSASQQDLWKMTGSTDMWRQTSFSAGDKGSAPENKERELELHHIFFPHNFIHSIHITCMVCHSERSRRKS